nr:MAG TPA: hypothetical protein [Caudoviricetes sp.]DAQ99531.1 MAG TPA: hypothetical protein [Caudoviricetes sp.]
MLLSRYHYGNKLATHKTRINSEFLRYGYQVTGLPHCFPCREK